MKIPWYFRSLTLFVVLILFCLMLRNNEKVSEGTEGFSYIDYIIAHANSAQDIMLFWHKQPYRIVAVQNMVILHWVLIAIYGIYLGISLFFRAKREYLKWLRIWLYAGIALVVVSAVVGIYLGILVRQALNNPTEFNSMRSYSLALLTLMAMAFLPLLIALLPTGLLSKAFRDRVIRFLSQLLKTIWLFFPGIFFLFLLAFCFWMIGQGKDFIVAFTHNQKKEAITFIIFFIVIGFFAYISWYSSRIIAYIKKWQQKELMKKVGVNIDDAKAEAAYNSNHPFFEISKPYLEEAPRLIGNAVFLILELAILQIPLFNPTLTILESFLLFLFLLVHLNYLDRWFRNKISGTEIFKTAFWISAISFTTILLILSLIPSGLSILLWLLLLLHIVFISYTNLRRVEVEKNATKKVARAEIEKKKPTSWLLKSMEFFCIPFKETGYYHWFLILSGIGIVLYFLNVIYLHFSRSMGPFPAVILAFAILLAFGNFVTAFSVRYRVNFHFLFFSIALVVSGLRETHNVKTMNLKEARNMYNGRPELKSYLQAWLNDRQVSMDTSANGYDMYFILANGGASRSGYWTASVLGELEDASLRASQTDTTGYGRFSDHIFCLSGTSGGGVGVATFFALLRDKLNGTKPVYASSGKAFMGKDHFTHTFARMMGPDFFNYIIPYSSRTDRARALEKSFEDTSGFASKDLYRVPFHDPFSTFPALVNDSTIHLPILFINTTRMQDGNPGIVSNIRIDRDYFNNRVDVVKLLPENEDISITSGSILGARFPYISPAGRIGNDYFVDGGYFDNSGAGVVQETIRAIINLAKEDSILNGNSGKIYSQVQKVNFKVLHITNSPVIVSVATSKPVATIQNDLLAPLLTILGAYDMQTTVNDRRLINFIEDLARFTPNKAEYIQIPLYKDSLEWQKDPLRKRNRTEPPYAMNWFMSDTTRLRIDKRSSDHSKIKSIIATFR